MQHKNIFATHILQNLNHDFAVGESSDIGTTEGNIELLGNSGSELRIGITSEYHQAVLRHVNPLKKIKRHTPCVMAEEVGIEPTNAGIKIRCLTTWRLPNNLLTHPVMQRMLI